MAATLSPNTSLHYPANGDFVNGVYTPATNGLNLADVGSADMLDYCRRASKVWSGWA